MSSFLCWWAGWASFAPPVLHSTRLPGSISQDPLPSGCQPRVLPRGTSEHEGAGNLGCLFLTPSPSVPSCWAETLTSKRSPSSHICFCPALTKRAGRWDGLGHPGKEEGEKTKGVTTSMLRCSITIPGCKCPGASLTVASYAY